MANKPVLAAFFIATIGVAAGTAWAATDSAHDAAEQAATVRDFGKLSAAGANGFRDLKLARVAIYNGQTAQAKTYAAQADQLFAKAKTDDTAFMKAHSELVTASEMAAHKTAATTGDQPAAAPGSNEKIAWLPVDGAMNVDESYTASPAKIKAVGEADKRLAKGDRQGAIDQLKLAGIDTSVVIEVVPLDQTIADVHQASQMIDAGKYYEGSQMLRKVQVDARFDVTNVVATPRTAAAPAAKNTPMTADTGKASDAPKAN